MKKKRHLWAAILLLLLIAFFATGCKPSQIITEKVVREVDSTAILKLQSKVDFQEKTIESLTTDLKRVREENVRLQGEVSKHEINYNTEAPVSPETGKYPIASEVITESRTMLEKSIKEFEILKQEYRKEAEALTQKNSNLELTIESLRDENRELRAKITPTTGFNFRLFISGMGVGVVLMIALWLFLKFR